MIDYTYFNHQDFIEDPSFRRWVYEPESKEAHFWQQWLLANSHKEREVELARSILLSIKGQVGEISSERVKTNVTAILKQLDEKKINPSNQVRFSWIAAAATIVLMISFLGYLYFPAHHTSITSKPFKKSPRQILKEIKNTSDAERQIKLPDGSTVILLGHSTISFPARFAKERREIYLSGEAFFEVTKNPSQPFYVYANELVTKVLGTSFLVKAYEADTEVRVIVKTGKVSVYTKSVQKDTNQETSNESSNLVLMPDQQVVLLRDKIQLIKSVVAQPVIALKPSAVQNFTFDRTPVADVFSKLEKAYDINIVFDTENIKNCTVTAVLDNEPLHEKLQLICTIIEADYEYVDKKFIINSKGCQ